MAKLTKKSTNMTSFHGSVIWCTAKQLIDAVGKPQHMDNTGEDKTNFEWECQTRSGKVFTIYDWKEYRVIDLNEPIEFHIGGFGFMDTEEACDELLEQILKNNLENA
jgi:hypothetical protein